MLIVDTGVLVAATDLDEPEHDACADLLENETEPLVTTAMVIAETAYLLDRELGPQTEATLYESITRGQLTIEPLTLPIGSASVSSSSNTPTCVWAAPSPASSPWPNATAKQRIATLNRRHFGVVRPAHIDSFTLLPVRP